MEVQCINKLLCLYSDEKKSNNGIREAVHRDFYLYLKLVKKNVIKFSLELSEISNQNMASLQC